MGTPFRIDRSNAEDEVWAWLEPQFHRHGRQLYRFAFGVLGNREDAEDATQIVLLNAYRALMRGERPAWPRAWLFAIALNVCRRLRRQASARHALVASTRELLSLEPGADAPTGTEILQALSSLSPGQRRIFLLRELRGLSYAELSERLDISPAAAESLLARARRRLREELAPAEETTGLRPSRRRSLISIPGAGAALRLARAPATFKLAGLAGLAGTAAIAPALVVGLHGAPERAQPAGLQAAVPPISQPVQRTRARLAKRLLSSPASTAGPIRSRSSGAFTVDARSVSPASAGPATVAVPTAAASPEPETGATEVVSPHASPIDDPSSGVRRRPHVKPSRTTPPLPIPGGPAADDDPLATTVVTAVDQLVTAVPAPLVPPDVTPDAVPEGVVPDPPQVVQDVLDKASSAVPTLPAVGP